MSKDLYDEAMIDVLGSDKMLSDPCVIKVAFLNRPPTHLT
jgi:hypothetical protein